MPAKKYIVELDAGERERLNGLIEKGKAAAKFILKARILLKADQSKDGPGWRDADIVEALDTNLIMVMRVRETFVAEGPNVVCTAEEQCSAPEIADQLSRFAVPGQNPPYRRAMARKTQFTIRSPASTPATSTPRSARTV